jgi:hypothetical protein
MLNGVVALPYTRGHRQGAITATSEAQKTTESYMGETFSRRWELSKIKNTPEFQATRSLLDIFNQKGFFINPGTTKSGFAFNAMTLHGKIFVNAETQDSTHSMLFSTGHELVHRLRQEHPDLYDKLYDVVAEESNNRDGILRKYAERYTELKGNNDKIFEEFVSDVMGDAFRDKGFWQKVYAKSPELFQKLIDILDSILKQLRFNASAHGIRHFIKDLERVHEVASDVMAEYAKRQNKGVGGELAFQKNQIEPNAIEEAKSIELIKDKDGNLLAPNGEKSNLDEELWQIVRTPTFKKWFGDWEKGQQKAFLDGDPIISLKGDEFQKIDGESIVPRVAKWYMEEYGGKVTNNTIGEVLLEERGVKDSLSHGLRRKKAVAFKAVPSIIKNGEIISSRINNDRNKTDRYLISAPIEIGGEKYISVVVVLKDKNTQRFYLHDVILKKQLQASLKTGALTSISTPQTGDAEAVSYVKLLQNILSFQGNSSKVVDANGEPLVVYHGTPSSSDIEMFKFDPKDTGEDASGIGFYLTSSPSEASGYAKDRPSPQKQGDKESPGVLPLFVRINDPIKLDINNQTLNDLKITTEQAYQLIKKSPDIYDYDDTPLWNFMDLNGYDKIEDWMIREIADGYKDHYWAIYGDFYSQEQGAFTTAILDVLGYDGVVKEIEGRNHYVAFEPTQIKSIFNKGGFSLTDDRILEQKKTPTPTFFSQAQRVVGDKFPNKMASMSLVNWLKKNQVKEEEIYWLDIKSLTQGKKHVTREELLDWINANEVVVTDVIKGDRTVLDILETTDTNHSDYQLPGGEDYGELLLTLPQQRKAGFMVRYKGSPSGEFDTRQEAEAYIIKVAGKHPTERQKYKIEGRLFEKGGVFTSPHYDEANILAHIRFNTRHDSDGNKVLFLEEIQSDWQAKGLDEGFHQKPELTDWAEIKDDSAITPDGAWYSTWNEHGYIIFKTDDGNYKTAVIADGAPEHNSGYVTRGTFKDVEQYILRSLKKTKSVPKAPFVSDKKGEASSEWIRLVMKRMLRYGAENGFDKISWTTGAQQIERWKSNLRQNVDQIHWQRGKGFSADQSAYLTKEEIKEAEITHVILNGIKNGNNVFSQTVPIKGEVTIEGQKVTLDRLLGKSMARKIRASKDRTGILDGDNLTIGGGVHKSIYDNAIPSIANKLGKQFGTKVGETEINKQANGLLFYDIVRADNNDPTIWASLDSKEKAEAEVKRLEEDPSKKYKINRAVLTQPSIDITPEMRESVMQGQPQFQRKGKEKPFRFDEKTGALPKGLYTSLLKIGNKKNRRHKDFWAGKSGDNKASDRAVEDLVKPEAIEYAKTFGKDAIFVPIVSKEGTGENQIPNALANFLALKTGAMLDTDIKHINKPEHTGKSVIHRIMNPLIFEGNVQKGGEYVLVDDTVATGGSLADLGQYLEENGGKVVGIMPLVNASRSGNLTPSKELLNELQKKFGKEIEQEFGIKLEALTYPEAYALNKFQSIDSIRKRVSLERKDKSDQRASGTLGQSADNQSNLNKPQFQKADQNRPDFINHHLASVRPVKRLLLL